MYEDLGTPDEFLGRVHIPLAELCDGQPHDLDLGLEGKQGAGAGRISLAVKFVPIAGEAARHQP